MPLQTKQGGHPHTSQLPHYGTPFSPSAVRFTIPGGGKSEVIGDKAVGVIGESGGGGGCFFFSYCQGESGCTMATASGQLLSASFFGHTAGLTRAGCPVKALERDASCRVTCSSGIGSRVRESLKMAVILPIAACTVLAASPLQADAGMLSGASGMESVELPSIPEPDFLKKLQDDKKKMYEGQDEAFRTSSYLQELLKKSKENAAMHKKEIADKYCERGAEWGVGDCSLRGMNQEQKEEFMRVLKQK